MPEICRFFGIIVTMNFADHNPPHFHARYGSRSAIFSIQPIALIDGELPPRITGFVTEWASQHRGELLENWRRARAMQPLHRIAPLE